MGSHLVRLSENAKSKKTYIVSKGLMTRKFAKMPILGQPLATWYTQIELYNCFMARPARIEYKGAFYHVMNRGNRREAIFIDNHDRARFYEIIGNIESRYKIIIYSFVLMSNHYHLIIETPLGNLSRAIQRLNGDYALYFSRRHNKRGQACCWLNCWIML